MNALKQKIVNRLAETGRQSSCQLSVDLREPWHRISKELHELEREGRVRREPLPPHLEKYQERNADGEPLIFLFRLEDEPSLAEPTVLSL
jgi:hypothetical protein